MISSLLINFVLFYFLGFFLCKVPVIKKALSILIRASLLVGGLWLLVTCIGYLATPLFFDHAESAVAAVGANWLHGGSLYTELDSPYRHSILYGPLPYIVSALFQSFPVLDSILLAKLVGVLNLLCIFFAAGYLAFKQKTNKSDTLLALCAVALTMLSFYNQTYWNRPDSFLIAFVFLSFLVIRKDDGRGLWISYLLLGFFTGLATNCKIHGFLYFLPLVALFFESDRKVFSWKKSFSAIAVSLIVFAIPFFLTGIDFSNYFAWLGMASKHGLVFKDVIKNSTYIGSFLLLLGVMGFYRKRPWTYITSIIISLLIAVIASKPGSGAPHFLPLMPVFMWWACEVFAQANSTDKKRLSLVMGAFLLMLSLNSINKQKRVYVLFKETPMRWAEYADFKKMVSSLEGLVEVGYTQSYESSFYKPWLVLRGGGLLFESSALMDMKASDIGIPDATLDVIANCRIPYFVFPAGGDIWALNSFYDSAPMFDANFLELFNSKYSLIQTSGFYRLYSCKK